MRDLSVASVSLANDGFPDVRFAATNGPTEVVRLLLDRVASINDNSEPCLLQIQDDADLEVDEMSCAWISRIGTGINQGLQSRQTRRVGGG